MFLFFSSPKSFMFFFFISIIIDCLPRDGKDVRHVHTTAAPSPLQHVDEDLKEPSEPGQSRQRAKEEELFPGTNIFSGTSILPGANNFPGTNIVPGANIFFKHKYFSRCKYFFLVQTWSVSKNKNCCKKQIRRQLFKYQFLKLISMDSSVRERWNEFGNQDKVVLGKAVLMHSFCCWAFKSDAWFFYIKNFF